MSQIKVELSVSKETYEVGAAVAGLVASIKAKSADGLKLEEVVQAVSENIGKVMVAMEGADKVGAEWAEDPKASVQAALVVGAEILSALLLKKAEVAPSGAV